MKLIVKIIGVIVLLIVAAMVIIPFFFRNQIVTKVKEEINKSVNADVDFSNFSLSLFRSFPDFNFRLSGLSVINHQPFEGDTLVFVPQLNLTLDLMSVFKGDAYVIESVELNQPEINLLVVEEGTANWDIMLPADSVTEDKPETESSSSMLIRLDLVKINDANLVYDDKSLVTYVEAFGLDHVLSGDFTMDFTTLNTHTYVDEITVYYDQIKYLHRINATLNAPIEADLKNYIFTFKNSDLLLNDLALIIEGTFAMPDNGDYVMAFTFSTKKTDFKNFISLIPAIYMNDFEKIKTAGTAVINGNIKGVYNDTSYPGFEINILVNNARFHYPELPKSVDEINLKTKINYPGGNDFDQLVVDINDFSLYMGGNKLASSLHISHPVSDLFLRGEVDGVIDLSGIKDFYPLSGNEELQGKITSKLLFDGHMSAIEQGKYDEFTLLGSVLLTDISYKSSMFDKPVEVSNAQMNFSPQFVDLSSLKVAIGKNDISANGKLENFLPYAFEDGILSGNLQINSNYLNISQLLPEYDEQTDNEADTASMTVIEVPENVDFTLQSTINTLIFDSIEFKNLEGKLMVKNQAILLDRLNMEILDGTMAISGKYDTKEPDNPKAEFDMELNNIDIQKSYFTFGTIEKFAPIAQKTNGKFSAALNLKTLLDNKLMPVYSTMNGGGALNTSEIVIENLNTINKLADLLKMPGLKRLQLEPVNLSFEFVDGKVHVKPFDVNYQEISTNILGWVSFDQTIDFDLVMIVPRNKFGGSANAVLDNLVAEANKLGTNFSVGDKISINSKITGTTSDPQIKLLPGEGSGKSLIDDLKKRAQEELNLQKQQLEDQARKELEKKKEEARKEADALIAKADEQAAKILKEAQKQADAINATAASAAEKLKKEASTQSQKLIDDAAKKGALAEIAARKAAEKVVKEAENKAGQMVSEAHEKSEKLMQEAQKQADKIKENARNQANKLIDNI